MVIGIISVLTGFAIILSLTTLGLDVAGIRKEPAGRGIAITGVILSGLNWLLRGGAHLIFDLLAVSVSTH